LAGGVIASLLIVKAVIWLLALGAATTSIANTAKS